MNNYVSISFLQFWPNWKQDSPAKVTVPHITQCSKFSSILVISIVCNRRKWVFNNKIQTIQLVGERIKLYPFLTNRAFEARYPCYKSSLRGSICMFSRGKVPRGIYVELCHVRTCKPSLRGSIYSMDIEPQRLDLLEMDIV